MNSDHASFSSASLQCLLFSIGGVRFGVDVDQIASISPHDGKEIEDFFPLHSTIGLNGREILYNVPTVLTIRGSGKRNCRVLIEAPEDLIDIRMEEIRPFPPVIEPFVRPRGLWAIWVQNQKQVLLLDFQYLLRKENAVCDE